MVWILVKHSIGIDSCKCSAKTVISLKSRVRDSKERADLANCLRAKKKFGASLELFFSLGTLRAKDLKSEQWLANLVNKDLVGESE